MSVVTPVTINLEQGYEPNFCEFSGIVIAVPCLDTPLSNFCTGLQLCKQKSSVQFLVNKMNPSSSSILVYHSARKLGAVVPFSQAISAASAISSICK